MAIYHIVLFKLKADIDPSRLEVWKETVREMVGQVPGLQRVDVNRPHPSTAARAQGFDIALVAVLDAPDVIAVYAAHPAHLKVISFREELFTDALGYDLEFTP